MLHRQLVILPSNHLTVHVSGGMSRPCKRHGCCNPAKYLIVDTDSDEARVSGDISSVEGGSESVPGVSQPELYRQTASCHEYSSSVLSNASDKEDAGDSGPDEQTQQPVTLQWTCHSCPQGSVAHTHIQGAPEERRTMKHQTKMTTQVHLVFSFCIFQKLSLCWYWRLTATTMITQTGLTMDPLLNLTLLKLKCLCFWHCQ